MSPADSIVVMTGVLLAILVSDGDLALADVGRGLPGLREITYLIEGPDGIPVLVVER